MSCRIASYLSKGKPGVNLRIDMHVEDLRSLYEHSDSVMLLGIDGAV